MTRTEARERLDRSRGRGVKVAVVDSGWSSDLQDPRVHAQVTSSGEVDDLGDDTIGHGTACALRILQVAPEAEIVPIKVFHDRLETSIEPLCEAIQVAHRTGVQVINLSLATRRPDAVRPLFLVCEEARRDGIVVVAAVHNGGGQAFPASLEPALSVEEGAQRELLHFTYHPDAQVECTAAGFGAPIKASGGRSIRRSGSSVAAATLSGVVARLLETDPGDLDSVRHLLDLTSTPSPENGLPFRLRKG